MSFLNKIFPPKPGTEGSANGVTQAQTFIQAPQVQPGASPVTPAPTAPGMPPPIGSEAAAVPSAPVAPDLNETIVAVPQPLGDPSIQYGDPLAAPAAPVVPQPQAPAAPAPGAPGMPPPIGSEPGAPAPFSVGGAAAPVAPAPQTELELQREALSRKFAELQWDLGGMAYEMAIRDHFRVDVLARQAAELQDVDAQLGSIERMLKLGSEGAAGTCPKCNAPFARGAVFCWRCGQGLQAQTPVDQIG